jgi:hypothetical protein
MRIVANERHIKVRHFIGQYATLGGLVALVAGLIISFVAPEQFAITMGCMTLGILLSLIGGFFANRYAGPLAHHEALPRALKGLSQQYALLNYMLPAPHVLVEPSGLTAIVVRSHKGHIAYRENGRWQHRQAGKFFRQLVGQESLGTPDLEAQRQIEKLGSWLADRLPDAEIPIRAVIVFVNPDADLEADGSPVPAFYGKKVKAWLRGPGKLKALPGSVHRQLLEALGVETDTTAQASETPQ